MPARHAHAGFRYWGQEDLACALLRSLEGSARAQVIVEHDNTQNGANHVHSVWIDPEAVFGRDLLKAHDQGAN